MMLENKLSDDIERVRELNYLIGSLPSSSKYFPDFESRMVYLRHLAKLCQLPYWRTAEPKEIHDLIIDLRHWVITAAEKKKNPKRKSILGGCLIGLFSFVLRITEITPLLWSNALYESTVQKHLGLLTSDLI